MYLPLVRVKDAKMTQIEHILFDESVKKVYESTLKG